MVVRWIVCAAVLTTLALGGCAPRRAIPPPPGKVQTGIASWYGPGFHGRATSSGERYDQNALTAAHPTLPLGTRARVTNLETGRSIEVRINDRGPFVKERAIDLSYGAASAIGMVGPGTAPVRIDVVEHPAGGFTHVLYSVQVGAFGDASKAGALRAELAPRYAEVYISPVLTRAERLYRVRVGPYAERRQAESRALELSRLGLPAVVTEEPRR